MKGNALLHYVKYFFGIDKPDTQTTANVMFAVWIGVFEGVNTEIITSS